MRLIITLGLMVFATAVHSSPQDYRTTPVPILKQVNRHNDDGSYSYGYEGADGTYKIETKYPTGEVFGKYGYIGDDGKLREVEYGASKRGFEPTGSDINVAPPTLSNSIEPDTSAFDSSQYKKSPTLYYRKSSPSTFSNRYQLPATRTIFTNRFQSPSFQATQTQYYQPHTQYDQHQPPYYQPRFPAFTFDPTIFNGHPATNFDISSGSYTISYSG